MTERESVFSCKLPQRFVPRNDEKQIASLVFNAIRIKKPTPQSLP
jgi:hypothetical protein